MKTTFDLVDIVWTALSATQLKQQISGGIYKHLRPLNSRLEDVVINALPISADQLQQAVLNVNVHVPNIVISVNGLQDSTQPNGPRLRELGAIAITALEQLAGPGYSAQVQQQNIIQDTDDYFNNIRIQFYIFNNSN